MTKSLVAMAVAAMISLTACNSGNSNANNTSDTVTDVADLDLDLPNGTPGLAKRIISEDLYIDLDTADLNEVQNVMSVCTRRQIYGEDIPAVEITDRINDNIAKAKAAAYRFMSHLSPVDRQLVLDSTCTAGSLKMKQEIFDKFVADNEQNNVFLRARTEAGDTTAIPPITQDELNAMLE